MTSRSSHATRTMDESRQSLPLSVSSGSDSEESSDGEDAVQPPPEDDLSDREENDDADLPVPGWKPQYNFPIRSPRRQRERPTSTLAPADSPVGNQSDSHTQAKKPCMTWSLELTYGLIKEAHVSYSEGLLVTTKKGGGFLRDVYEAWASELNKQNGLSLTYMQCQDCWMKMKKKAKQVKWMLDHSGASFNVETGRILASDDLWAALEANFGAEGRWMKSRPYVERG